MFSKDEEKDIVIANLKAKIAEMVSFISHLDLSDTICASMAEHNGEKEYGVCQCSCEDCIYNYFIGANE